MRDLEEFQVVIYRRNRGPGRSRSHRNHLENFLDNRSNNVSNDDSVVDYETLSRKMLDARDELKNSVFAESLDRGLKEALSALKIDRVSDVLCYGLGRFTWQRSSKFQLALLLLLKERFDPRISIYDPIFEAYEIELLRRFGFDLIEKNEKGKRVIMDRATLVFMPHCPNHLINNLLYTNWGLKLYNCILLTNSFTSLVENPNRWFGHSDVIDYMSHVQPYADEIRLRNDFAYEEVFNDLSIHVFPRENMARVAPNFWSAIRGEPSYPFLEARCNRSEEEIGNYPKRQKRNAMKDAKSFLGDHLLHESGCLSKRQRDSLEMNSNVRLVRSLLREIRRNSSRGSIEENIMARYVLEQAKIHRETSEVLCKAREELKNLAETYLCYLNSRRMCREIETRYAGRGERSVKETADLVGFKLPHDPK